MALCNIESFLEFIKTNSIKNVFYKYSYYDKSSYIIEEEEAKLEYESFYEKEFKSIYIPRFRSSFYENYMEVNQNIFKKILKEIKDNNKKIKTINFEKPYHMIVFCKYEGDYIYVEDCDNWIEQFNLYDSLEFFEKIFAKYYAEINEEIFSKIKRIMDDKEKQIEEEEEEKRKALKELELNLKDIIKSDIDFINCRTKELRKIYIKLLLDRKEMKKYKEIFYMDNNRSSYSVAFAEYFIENLWEEIKKK